MALGPERQLINVKTVFQSINYNLNTSWVILKDASYFETPKKKNLNMLTQLFEAEKINGLCYGHGNAKSRDGLFRVVQEACLQCTAVTHRAPSESCVLSHILMLVALLIGEHLFWRRFLLYLKRSFEVKRPDDKLSFNNSLVVTSFASFLLEYRLIKLK